MAVIKGMPVLIFKWKFALKRIANADYRFEI